jgi:hypothetical protein
MIGPIQDLYNAGIKILMNESVVDYDSKTNRVKKLKSYLDNFKDITYNQTKKILALANLKNTTIESELNQDYNKKRYLSINSETTTNIISFVPPPILSETFAFSNESISLSNKFSFDNGLSVLNLTTCEKQLREYYNISNNKPLAITKLSINYELKQAINLNPNKIVGVKIFIFIL